MGVDGGRCSVYKQGALYWLPEKPIYKEGTRRGKEPCYSTMKGGGAEEGTC